MDSLLRVASLIPLALCATAAAQDWVKPPCSSNLESNPNYLYLVSSASEPSWVKLADAKRQSILKEYSGDILVTESAAIAPTRIALADYGNNSALVVWSRSEAPATGLSVLDKRPKNITIMHSLPLSFDELVAIHGQGVSTISKGAIATELAGLEKIRSDANKLVCEATMLPGIRLSVLDLHSGGKSARLTALDALASGEQDDLILMMGHVEKGQLCLHDGSKLDLKQLRSRARRCVISCSNLDGLTTEPGLQVVSERSITYGTAARIVHDLVSEMAPEKGSYRKGLLKVQNRDYQKNRGASPDDGHASDKAIPQAAPASQPKSSPQHFGGPLLTIVKAEDSTQVIVIGECA